MSAPDFWNNRERAQADVEEVSRLRSLINPFRELEKELQDFQALQDLAAEETEAAARAQAEQEVTNELARIVRKVEEFELRQFLSGPNDRSNAFVTIHSGAGGTEVTEYSDWKPFGTLTLPTTFSIMVNGEKNARGTVKSAEVNPTIDANAFEKPKP